MAPPFLTMSVTLQIYCAKMEAEMVDDTEMKRQIEELIKHGYHYNYYNDTFSRQQFGPTEATLNIGSLAPMSMADLLALPDKKVEWIWQDYLAEGDFSILAGFMKVGKSTLYTPLALAVARGDPFLERETKQGAVLILALEENQRDVKLRFEKLGATGNEPIFVHSKPLLCSPAGAEELRKFALEKSIRLVIVDSLSKYAGFVDENNNAEVQRKLNPLLDLAHSDNIAFLVIHHESKHGGKNKKGETVADGRSIRGASSLLGTVDQAMMLSRTPGNSEFRRSIKTIGRRAESPPELIIELQGETKLSVPRPYWFKVIGTPDQLDKAAQQIKVADILTTEWQTIKEIVEQAREAWDLGDMPVRAALKALEQGGKAQRQGSGTKNDPFEYRVPLPGDQGNDAVGIRLQGYTNPSIRKETNLSGTEPPSEPKKGDDIRFFSNQPLREETKTNPDAGHGPARVVEVSGDE